MRWIILLLALLTAVPAYAASGITAGAIRWDAWYSGAGSALQAQYALGPSVWQSRAPINCSAASAFAITCAATQTAMDAEIAAAVSGGLKFWAFDQYASNSSLTPAWSLYQSSTHKNDINWCWISALSLMGSTGSFTSTNASFVAQFQQSNFQKVTVTTANRPVLFIAYSTADLASNWGNSLTNVAAMITDLRAQTVAAGLGTPYIVVFSGTPATAAAVVTAIGADAISSYNPPIPSTYAGTYAALDTSTQTYWATLAGASSQIVPIAINGWDPRPRRIRPEAFSGASKAFIGMNNYAAISTNTEFANHLQAAVTYINAHPTVVPSTLLLIYAWTECDEGGCITPTIGDPTGSKLSAIASVIR
jgi:hypothetical protein